MKFLSFILINMVNFMARAEMVDVMLSPVEIKSTITFTEAIHRALARNGGLKEIEQEIVIADSDTIASVSKHLPKVVTRASHTAINKKGEANLEETTHAGIAVDIPLLDAKTLIDIREKRENAEAARDNYRFEQESLISLVGNLYIEALIARATKENSVEELDTYQKSLSVLQKKSEAGSARPLDVIRAQYLASKAHSDFLEKSSEFQKRMGELGQKIDMREDFLLGDVSIDSPHFSKSKDELLQIANHASDVSVLERNIASAGYAVLSEKFDFFPKFSATVDGGFENNYEKFMMSSVWTPSVKMMVNVEIPLFTGLSSTAAIRSKTATKTVSELALRAKNNEKVLSLNGLLSQINDLAIVRTSAEVALDAATKAKESTDRLHAIGEATGLELVEANNNLFNAKNQVVTTTLRLEQVKLRLLFLIGKISEIIPPFRLPLSSSSGLTRGPLRNIEITDLTLRRDPRVKPEEDGRGTERDGKGTEKGRKGTEKERKRDGKGTEKERKRDDGQMASTHHSPTN